MYIKASYISALRISLGLAFFVSALFKGLNMFSTAMNIQSYADALKFDFSLPYYDVFAILLIFVESLLGIFLMAGLFRRVVRISSFLLVLFFLVLTFWVSYNDLLDDCGCFGDVLRMSPFISFLKNVILLLVVVILLLDRKDEVPKHQIKLASVFVIWSFIFVSICYYAQPYFGAMPFWEKETIDYAGISFDDNNNSGMKKLSKLNSGMTRGKMLVGVVRDFQSENLYYLNEFIKSLLYLSKEKDNLAPAVILTSTSHPDRYFRNSNIMIGKVDNYMIKEVMSPNVGFIYLDNGVIVKKWQQHAWLNLKYPQKIEDMMSNNYGVALFAVIWMLLLVVLMKFVFINKY